LKRALLAASCAFAQHLNIENDMVKSDNAATNWTPLIQTPDANGAKLGESNVMTSSLKYVMTSGEVTPNHMVFFRSLWLFE
jgi:hypothetical protein